MSEIEHAISELVEGEGLDTVREYIWLDKSDWSVGPWKTEVDKRQWIDKATGLDCLIVRRADSGHWCGYVGVPEGHPYFGLHEYNEIPMDVHGGLSYAEGRAEGPEHNSICHIPISGRGEVWWLGFDCAHGGDLAPAWHSAMRAMSYQAYRTQEYVMGECARLAEQLVVKQLVSGE